MSTETKSADPAWGAKHYQPRPMSMHMRLCDEYGVSVVRERAPHDDKHTGWWRATAHDRHGAVLYATGGRTRRHAETNALNGVGAPMRDDRVGVFEAFADNGPA